MVLSLAAFFILALSAAAAPSTHLPLLKNLTTSAVIFDDNFESYAVPASPAPLNLPSTASALVGSWSYGTSYGAYTIGIVNPERSVSGAIVPQEGGQCLMLSATNVGTTPGRTISITRSGTDVILSWPLPATAVVLEATTALVPAAWESVSSPAMTNGATVSDTVSATGSKFYRLRQL